MRYRNQATVLEETGILRVRVDLKLWSELDKLSKRTDIDIDVPRELVNRIHLKDKELSDAWNKSTVRQRIQSFYMKRIPINKSPEDGRRVEILHKSIWRNYGSRSAKLILEYNLVIKQLIDDIKALNDDGGERE